MPNGNLSWYEKFVDFIKGGQSDFSGGLMTSVVVGVTTKIFASEISSERGKRRRVLLKTYKETAAQKYNLTRWRKWILFRNRKLRSEIVNERFSPSSEWEILKPLLRKSGVEEKQLRMQSSFYKALAQRLRISGQEPVKPYLAEVEKYLEQVKPKKEQPEVSGYNCQKAH